METALDRFFSAWGETAPDARYDLISGAMAEGFAYADPRTAAPITDIDALAEYVGQFTANAPGWSASVLRTDTTAGFSRSLVGFGDAGGVKQHGQYFSKGDGDGRLKRLIGFAGIGAPE